mmetsp:Transcript_36090/g.69202  ORF Transcript_36090/g.69202 Transcript_36090/m.69202 type:complete len:99 (+) Transcript_36090:2207-2503(+)
MVEGWRWRRYRLWQHVIIAYIMDSHSTPARSNEFLERRRVVWRKPCGLSRWVLWAIFYKSRRCVHVLEPWYWSSVFMGGHFVVRRFYVRERCERCLGV